MSRLVLDLDGSQHVVVSPGPWNFGPDQSPGFAPVAFRLRWTNRWTLFVPDAGTTVELDGEALGAPASVMLRNLDEGHVVRLRHGARSCLVRLGTASASAAPDVPPADTRRELVVGNHEVFIGGHGGSADLHLDDPELADRHVRITRSRDGALRISERSEPPLLRHAGQLVSRVNLDEGERFTIGQHELVVTSTGVRSLGRAAWADGLGPEPARPATASAATPRQPRRPDAGAHDQIATDIRLTLRLHSAEHDLDVHLNHPMATVGDLLRAAGQPGVSMLHHGSTPVPTSTPLLDAALPEGSVLSAAPMTDEVSGSHADRPFGLTIKGQLTGANTVPFNRPPRPESVDEHAPLTPPRKAPPATPAQFSWALLLGGLLFAAIAVAVTREPSYAVFTALGPLLSVGTYYEQRRRQRRTDRENAQRFTEDLSAFSASVAAQTAAERDQRRRRCPEPSEFARRAALPSRLLWERRIGAADYLHLRAGVGDIAWAPRLRDGSGDIEPEAQEVIDKVRLVDTPVHVDLSAAGVVGVVGDRQAALAVARSLLCQAAVQTGPADLTIAAFVDPGREADWEWVKWLPHSRRSQTSTSGRWTAHDRETSNYLLRALPAQVDTRTCLVLLDSDVLLEGRMSPGRKALGLVLGDGTSPVLQISGIVVAPTPDQLPAVCRAVVDLRPQTGAQVMYVETDTTIESVTPAEMTVDAADLTARALARFDDPEGSTAGGGLPGLVRLLPLLELDGLDGASIRSRWASLSAEPGLRFPLGLTEQGVFELDLVRDGPHGLVAGMTGSGKSEFLRSLVLSLAASYDTTRLNLILIDFKGGAAFDVCSQLPHVVGMVTNLKEQLANRALRALEAELHYRERLFAEVSVDNVDDYRRVRPEAPLPRLLIVVDEFAMLAKEFPDLLTSLVSVAALGRTLGVHLVLATQRPAGVVSDDIAANTNLRVALQVKSNEDSSEVIDAPDAARISRLLRGRAYARLGHDELVPLQTALVTTVSRQDAQSPLECRPFSFGAANAAVAPAEASEVDAEAKDSARLIDAIRHAHLAAGHPEPRKPWPEALGPHIRLGEVARVRGQEVLFALADDPGQQRQFQVGWNLSEGNLLLVGLPGSGTTSTLAAIALTLADAWTSDQLELVVLDAGTGELAALGRLPQTTSVVLSGERRRQTRLLQHLRAELTSRRSQRQDGTSLGRTVVLIDNFAALQAELDDSQGLDLLQDFYQVFRDGPQAGMSFAVTADRVLAVPGAVANVVTQKWMFRAADPHDYSQVGVPATEAPPSIAGRAVLAENGLHAQVGALGRSLTDAVEHVVARHKGATTRPRRVQELPTVVNAEDLAVGARFEGARWSVPIGLAEADLEVAELVLHEGDHALITGANRSGKSSTLASIAQALHRGRELHGTELHIVGIGRSDSPLAKHALLDEFGQAADKPSLIAQLHHRQGPVALLIDDAPAIDDGDDGLANLIKRAPDGLHIFTAGRAADLRSMYSGWLKLVQRSRTGVLLQPDIHNGDDSLFGISLRVGADIRFPKGRGYVIESGEPTLAQAAKCCPKH